MIGIVPRAENVMPNVLMHALSPYLRAHAGNPVEWQVWDDATLERARREDRPLFVSVGYFACHWCHVMAREAFSDPEVAAILNADFISIKVDREERPDLDAVLQTAHQALTGQGGGWPLSVFMDPVTMTPFFAGTYFPLTPRYGRPGFAELLRRVVELWRTRREDLVAQGEALRQHLQAHAVGGATAEAVPDATLAADLVRDLGGIADAEHGGFGRGGPKFPQCPLLSFLQAARADERLRPALTAMARGGLRDHVGSGFFRYTVDAAWRVPHFEKMLADNAQLLAVYAVAARAGDVAWRTVALETAAFIEAELRLPEGGYATSLNAESAGVEGAFYLWDRAEVRGVVDAAAWPDFAAAFGLDGPPQVDGRWHLARVDTGTRDFTAALAELRAARASRPRPERDEQRLTSLNAMLVTALARAALSLDAPELGARARDLLALLERTVVSDTGVVAVSVGGKAAGAGLLPDYACLAEAALAVAALGDDGHAIGLAVRLAEWMLARFRLPDGGLALTDATREVLLYRPRAERDDALPAAAGVATRVLLALGHLLAEPRWLDAAEAVLRAAGGAMVQAPDRYATLVAVAAEFAQPPVLVVLRGEEAWPWACAVARQAPTARLAWLRGTVTMPNLTRYASRGAAAAFVCRGMRCSAPVTTLTALQAELAAA